MTIDRGLVRLLNIPNATSQPSTCQNLIPKRLQVIWGDFMFKKLKKKTEEAAKKTVDAGKKVGEKGVDVGKDVGKKGLKAGKKAGKEGVKLGKKAAKKTKKAIDEA